MVHRAMFYDMQKLHDKRFEEYCDEIEQGSDAPDGNQRKQRSSRQGRGVRGTKEWI